LELALSYVDQILIFAIFAVSLNLLLGYTGQISVAHAAFGAIGGYSIGYLLLNNHVPVLAGLGVAIVAAGLVGVIVGIPALRLSAEWLILLSLAAQTIIIALVSTSSAFGGTYGLQNIVGLSVFGHSLTNPSDRLPLFLVCFLIVYAICWRMGESPYGRVLRGIREDERACRSLGKNVFAYKLMVFGVTAAMAGVAGALLAIDSSLAAPALFGFDQSTTIIAMVILGGMGSLPGSVIGAALLVLLGPFFERVLNINGDVTFLWRLIAYGLVLVLVMLLRPQGLLPDPGAPLRWLRGRRARAGGGSAEPVLADTALPSATAAAAAAPAALPALERNGGDIVLEVSDLSKHFGGIIAADGLAFALRRGEIAALVGPNGAGKTTVFNLLTGAIRFDSGSVVLHGHEIGGMTPNQVARRGMVRSFQDVRIFPFMSALENVMLAFQEQPGEHLASLFGRPGVTAKVEREVRERAVEWLRFVGMDALAAMPAGALGFGQQKLVALARVLATEADVLLLDEPASGIDQQWVDVMLGLIDRVRAAGRTVCIVEHNLHVVERLADHIYFMELGRITARGSFDELTAMPNLAKAYFGTA